MKLLEKYKIDLIVDSRDGYKEAILSLLERHERRPNLLDLGSGDYKRLTLRVAERLNALSVTSIDIAGGWYIGRRDGRSYTCYLRDLNYPLAKTEVADVVIASQIIEHLWNTDGFLREIHKVLKPNGYAIISTPNLASWHNLLYLALGRQPETATVSDELYPWKEKPGHLRVFTATELIKLLRFHGFKVEKVIGTSYPPLVGRLAGLMSKLDWRHAGMITVKVRKQ